MKLSVMTYNTLFAGRDGEDNKRALMQAKIINDAAPDIFLLQEGKGLADFGSRAMFDLETQIGMRGFVAIAPRTGQHTAIFIRPHLRPTGFEQDGDNFHHALARLNIWLPNRHKLTVLGVHLCPYGPDVRHREACYLTPYPDPFSYALLAGDFNSMSHHDPDPADFGDLSLRDRSRYVADYMRTPDHGVSTRLEHAGWVDIGKAQGKNHIPTVPAGSFKNTEFPTMRCDFIMASDLLARRAASYEVIRNALTDDASDHYPVLATFDLED